MHVLVSGGTGFLGAALCRALRADGHRLTVLTRSAPDGVSRERSGLTHLGWRGEPGAWSGSLDGVDAVVNLAGATIAQRWTRSHKARVRESRVRGTRAIVDAIAAAPRPPSVLVSGSAVGFYGARGNEPVDERTPAGLDFLARVCVEWEKEAQRAEAGGTRVVLIRTGLALAPDGGAMAKLLPPFRFFAGGPFGSGEQYWPWIHRGDWVRLVRWAIDDPRVRGAINATAPAPVTNAAFARTLGRVLKRPAVLPAPAFALRLALGEMADMLLTGQRALPARAEALGFAFEHPQLEAALGDLLGK